MDHRFARIALAAAALVGGAAAAQAETARVAFHPYELATVAGQRAVLTRIQRAADRACSVDTTLAARAGNKACAADLTSQMMSQTRSPALMALWSGRANGNQLASNGG